MTEQQSVVEQQAPIRIEVVITVRMDGGVQVVSKQPLPDIIFALEAAKYAMFVKSSNPQGRSRLWSPGV